MSRAKKEETPGAMFERCLKRASELATTVLVTDGVMIVPSEAMSNDYFESVRQLADEFFGDYEETDQDDVVTYDEHHAMLAGAHMIGVAIGLRLRIGGAK